MVDPISFDLPDGPPLRRAAALALAVTAYARCDTFAELAGKAVAEDPTVFGRLADLDIAEHDLGLLTEHDQVLRLTSVKPLVTVAVCPVCGGWSLVSGPAPSTCRVLLGCGGKPVRAAKAVRRKAGVDTVVEPDDEFDVDWDPGPEAT